MFLRWCQLVLARAASAANGDATSPTGFRHRVTHCTLYAMLPPLRATVPSPSPSSISHRSLRSCSTLRSSSVCSSCAVFRLKRTKPPSLRTSCNRCSCSHPESTVAPRTCAPNHGERPSACPSPPAVGLSPSSNLMKSANTDDSALFAVTSRWRFNKSSHTTFSANWPSCCLSHVLQACSGLLSEPLTPSFPDACADSLMSFSASATLVETSLFIIMSILSETFFFVPSSFELTSSSRA